ncbi:hypothetical protein HU724_008980 [Pseudomonas iranensis]|uniref:hypothetical protein n=1 Tax=Pseudomonas iranensis TaxID=2745503 RepID=UPI001648851A|nr:hypothetical protein [Pseudomonas iranensis]QXI24400.1 hypothetical protein HU724_008980 [Pseudomonas iranensis]
MGWLSCLNKGFVWLIGGISVAAVMAAGGFALTATHFFYKRLKKVSKKTLAPTFGPRKLGSLRSGIDPGAAATVCFAAPPSAVYDCVVRSLRSHARINPSTQPSDVAGGSKARSKALELTLIVEWGGFAAGSCAALLFAFCGSEPAREGVCKITLYNGKYRLSSARNAAGFTGLAR